MKILSSKLKLLDQNIKFTKILNANNLKTIRHKLHINFFTQSWPLWIPLTLKAHEVFESAVIDIGNRNDQNKHITLNVIRLLFLN